MSVAETGYTMAVKSKGNWTIDALFAGRPECRGLFEAIRAHVESLGAVSVDVAKTQVSFGAATKFAWVWLPQMWIKKTKDTSVVVAFALDRQVVHPHIKSAVEPQPGRWTHHVVIDSDGDFDENVKGWLREAYLCASGKTRTKGRKARNPNSETRNKRAWPLEAGTKRDENTLDSCLRRNDDRAIFVANQKQQYGIPKQARRPNTRSVSSPPRFPRLTPLACWL